MTDDSQINISVCDKDVVPLLTGLTDSLLNNDFPVNFGSTLGLVLIVENGTLNRKWDLC